MYALVDDRVDVGLGEEVGGSPAAWIGPVPVEQPEVGLHLGTCRNSGIAPNLGVALWHEVLLLMTLFPLARAINLRHVALTLIIKPFLASLLLLQSLLIYLSCKLFAFLNFIASRALRVVLNGEVGRRGVLDHSQWLHLASSLNGRGLHDTD